MSPRLGPGCSSPIAAGLGVLVALALIAAALVRRLPGELRAADDAGAQRYLGRVVT